MRKRVLLSAGALLASLPLLADLTLAENGKSAYVIALPAKSTQVEINLAKEFQQHFARITGVTLPVKKENALEAGTPKIAIGKTELAKKNGAYQPKQDPEEMIVRTVGKDLILSGGNHVGTGFAVYDFLGKQGGCRWYDKHNIVIPRKEKWVIGDLNMKRSPSFSYRRIFTQAKNWDNAPLPGLPVSFSVASKATYNSIPNPVMGAPGDIHTFYLYSKDWPKDRLYLLSKTPEGRRRALRGQLGPNFCLSHPEAIDRFKKKLRQFIAADRKKCAKAGIAYPIYYNISMNDASRYFCRCEKCKAISDKHGESGLLLWFINQLADDIAKDYPDIWIHTAAYSFATKPAIGIKASPNVVVELAHNAGNYYSAIEDDATAEKGDMPYREYVTEWAKRTNRLAIWDYWIFYWDAFPEPYHNVHQIKKDLEFYYRNGVRLIRVESEAADTSSFFSLKYWLGYQLFDDLTQDDQKLIAEFMRDFYGPAAPEMKELLDYIAERQKGHFGVVFAKKRFDPNARPWIDAEFFRRTEDIFRRAEAKCAPGSMALKNVHRERLPIDLALMHKYEKIKPAIVSRKELAERYLRNAEEHIRLRKKASAIPAELLQAKEEAEKVLYGEQIEAMKKAPPPTCKIGKAWTNIPIGHTIAGVPVSDKRASVAARYENGTLFLRLIDKTNTAAFRKGVRVFLGDDWEVFLAPDRKGDYFQLMIGPNGKFETLYRHNGKPDECKVKGITVKSKLTKDLWELEVAIPVKELPFKVGAGNFIRGIPDAGVAWRPTFARQYGVPAVFGNLKLEE
ncbi:MAG: DUF4838 domain-containing protein [Lentisphaeria bacterium]|nr:DUF4838 domain-containing protein [Lentisphaeria bacterium]